MRSRSVGMGCDVRIDRVICENLEDVVLLSSENRAANCSPVATLILSARTQMRSSALALCEVSASRESALNQI